MSKMKMDQLLLEKGHLYPFNVVQATRRQFRCKWVLTTQGHLWPVVAEHFKNDPDNFDMYVVVEKSQASEIVQGLMESDFAVPIPQEANDIIEYLIEVKQDLGVFFIEECLKYVDTAMREGNTTMSKRKGMCLQMLLKLATKTVRDGRPGDLAARKAVLRQWLKWCLDNKVYVTAVFKEAALLGHNKVVSLLSVTLGR